MSHILKPELGFEVQKWSGFRDSLIMPQASHVRKIGSGGEAQEWLNIIKNQFISQKSRDKNMHLIQINLKMQDY